MSKLLKEGGLAGHMSHLYEDPYLTFKQIKDVLTRASEGRLEGTEKTDGQNLFISYSVKDGKAKAARNKGNIKGGGLTAKGLADKFGGRGTLEQAFTEAFDSFEKAVNSLTDEEKIEIFGKDADVFYNAEIQDPRNANVINYDFKTLNIHRVGHAKYNPETDKVEAVEGSENAEKLESALERMKDHLEQDDFRIQMNAIRTLDALSSDEQLSVALDKLEQIISSAGVSDDQTIGDYLTATIVPMIKQEFPSIPEEKMVMLMDRLFRGTEVPAKQIKSGLDKEQQKDVSAVVKKLTTYFKTAIAPIEDVVHDFAVDILKAFKSRFVLDNDKEIKRLQREVGAAISGIEASGREDALEIMAKQLSKLKKAENVSSAAEGFVFDYDGKTYKFTGNFAPANQLLGLFKYGRGKIPALARLNEEVEAGKQLILLPGGFKPPTKAHYQMIEYYNDHPRVGKVLVLIGPSPRGNYDRETSMKIFDLYGVDNLDKVEIMKTEYNSPIRAAYEFLISDPRREDYKQFSFGMGASDKGGDEERSKQFVEYFTEKKPEDLPEGFDVVEPPCCPAIGGDEPISATNLRKALDEEDLDTIERLIPDNIDPAELVSVIKGIQEISTMAGGNVQGYSLPLGAKPKYPKEDEENKEEQKIRELVRRGIKIIMEEKNRVQKLRAIVRKLINEKVDKITEQEEMAKGAHSTAINYLERVLKSVIPGKSGGTQLEPEYTSLSRPEYRKSFIKHVIQGLYDELTPAMSLTGLLDRFEKRRKQFDTKEGPLLEQEDITLKLGDDGLPEVEDQEGQDEPKDDFPEEEQITGENSIGRKAAYRFIKGQLDTIQGALNDLEETPKEREERKSVDPDSVDPQEEYLDFLFTNLMLHAYRLENKHFNSKDSDSEEFFKDIVDRAEQEREAGEEEIALDQDEEETQLSL